MLILFLSFSIYNHSLFNQFNARYQKEIDQYYSILELKNHFLQSGILFEEYMKTETAPPWLSLMIPMKKPGLL